MTPISIKPDTNRVVIILAVTENKKIIAAAFRWKKTKWVGTSSGGIYYDNELPESAVWIECPLQITE